MYKPRIVCFSVLFADSIKINQQNSKKCFPVFSLCVLYENLMATSKTRRFKRDVGLRRMWGGGGDVSGMDLGSRQRGRGT